MDYYGLMSPSKCLAASWLCLSLSSPLVVLAQADKPAAAPSSTTSTTPAASSTLNSELFHELLLAEISIREGDLGSGYALLLDAARKTNDAQVYQRAVDVALQARAGDMALQAARAWRLALPASRDANRYLLQILIGLNRLPEALDPLKREVALADAAERIAVISQLPRYLSRSSDKPLAASLLEQALEDQLSSKLTGAAAWTAVGQLRLDAGDKEGALQAARKGHTLSHDAKGPVLLAMALISPDLPQAQALVVQYLQGKPQPEVRMMYVRWLFETLRFAEASAQIHVLTKEKPDFEEAWLIQGSIELQDGQLEASEKSLLHYVSLVTASEKPQSEEHKRGLTQAYLSLAQVAEQRQNFPLAESWLSKISGTQELIRAQTRRAGILAKQGKLDDARKLIQALPERTLDDARLKVTSEVQLLREHQQWKLAFDVLGQFIESNPDDFDLLYEQATLAEKMGQLDDMERLLRDIMAGKPEYHHAYNALGYSLADRNIRLPEARTLILKALEFAPGDPFISDSLGWVEFRLGNVQEAVRILQAAFKSRPDAEIAAHLGEVLWSLGQREQAMRIWRSGAKLNADNETLVSTLKRLNIKL